MNKFPSIYDISKVQVMNLKFETIEGVDSFYRLDSQYVGFNTLKHDQKREKTVLSNIESGCLTNKILEIRNG